jgi:hypothetical protein
VAKRRTALWVALGVVAVVGLCYFALAFRPDSRRSRYDIGSEVLKHMYPGPTLTWIAPLEDPRTKIVPTEDGYRLEGAMRSDHADLLQYAKASKDGAFWFSIRVREYRVRGVLPGATVSSNDVAFKSVPSGSAWPK